MTSETDRRGGAGDYRREFRAMSLLALPVVAADLGWMAMGIVDTRIVGKLGAVATGAVGLGVNLHTALVIFGQGLMLGLDTMVAQDHGAGRPEEARRSLAQGVWLALLSSPLFMILTWALVPALPRLGLLPDVLEVAIPYLLALTWSTPSLLVFMAFRRHLQAVDAVRPVTFALVSANVVNAAACWVLVYGGPGFGGWGVEGAGWATGLARTWMAATLVAAFALREGREAFFRWPGIEPARFGRLVRLGWPAAVQVTLEVGVFAAATALAGGLDKVSLAAHQIVLTVSSLTFMVPLGVASAGAIRVGQAMGRGDPRAASASGWMAIIIGSGFMTCSGLGLLAAGRSIVAQFTDDPEVIATAVRLFSVAAAFQIFDGVQVIATGVLRGLGDTRSPMVCNLVAHWGVGLPLGYTLTFPMHKGIIGLWVGLSVGLILAGVANLAIWAWKSRREVALPGSGRIG